MPKSAHVCPDCGSEMHIPIGTTVTDTMGGGRQFSSPHWSEAMAIGASQIEAHKKLFPDVLVRQDGVIGFNSVQQQENYMTTCGFVKSPQKIGPLATR
jgi:hypothetical protein